MGQERKQTNKTVGFTSVNTDVSPPLQMPLGAEMRAEAFTGDTGKPYFLKG